VRRPDSKFRQNIGNKPVSRGHIHLRNLKKSRCEWSPAVEQKALEKLGVLGSHYYI
jgi:hypothetical protein